MMEFSSKYQQLKPNKRSVLLGLTEGVDLLIQTRQLETRPRPTLYFSRH